MQHELAAQVPNLTELLPPQEGLRPEQRAHVAEEAGPIAVKVTVVQGEAGSADATALPDVGMAFKSEEQLKDEGKFLGSYTTNVQAVRAQQHRDEVLYHEEYKKKEVKSDDLTLAA